MWAATWAVGCAGGVAPRGSEPPAPRVEHREARKAPPSQSGAGAPAALVGDGETFLRPNVTLEDGTEGYMHVTPDDMPWRIAIGYPKRPPKYGSRERAREVAIEAIRLWETPIRDRLPWFSLEFVEEDPEAPVQIAWKRRITGSWAGFGGFGWRVTPEGSVRMTGNMEVSTTPSNFQTLEIDELSVLMTHEFGHVLGLGHCLECDSAMNYAWHTRDRVFVTDLDVRTFLALVEQPNAIRSVGLRSRPARGPCKFVDILSGETDVRIDELRADDRITPDEQRCLRRVLQATDEALTAECEVQEVSFEAVLETLRTELASCVDASLVEQALRPQHD